MTGGGMLGVVGWLGIREKSGVGVPVNFLERKSNV